MSDLFPDGWAVTRSGDQIIKIVRSNEGLWMLAGAAEHYGPGERLLYLLCDHLLKLPGEVPAVSDLLVKAVECKLIRMSAVMNADVQDALIAFAKALLATRPAVPAGARAGDGIPAGLAKVRRLSIELRDAAAIEGTARRSPYEFSGTDQAMAALWAAIDEIAAAPAVSAPAEADTRDAARWRAFRMFPAQVKHDVLIYDSLVWAYGTDLDARVDAAMAKAAIPSPVTGDAAE